MRCPIEGDADGAFVIEGEIALAPGRAYLPALLADSGRDPRRGVAQPEDEYAGQRSTAP